MITIRSLSLAFGQQTLFSDLDVSFATTQKIGVVGRNGSGKSTLLKMIAHSLKPDAGTISIPSAITIAYMAQEMVLQSEKTVYDEAFTVFEQFITIESRFAELEHILQANNATADLVDEYLALQEKLSFFDKPTAEKQTIEILTGLGFNTVTLQEPVSNLSVGWKMRLVLAKLLLMKADFYLFDEPTNHLDIVAKEWFFEFLDNAQFGFLLVCHDRYFLEYACSAIFAIEQGNGIMHQGNLSSYTKLQAEQRAQLHAAHERQQREINRKQATIDRFRASASKAKMAQSMIKQLAKTERINLEPLGPSINITFPPTTRPGSVVLTVENLQHSFADKPVFSNASCQIMRGEKVAIIAPNGTGKTTLFNLIAGIYPIQNGTIEFGHNVEYALFEQDQARALDATKTIFQTIADSCPTIPDGTIRAFLGSFLFSGNDAYKKIGVLSGGEKNRVAMVRVLLQKANLLILDEPTNHLDMYAQDVLIQALQNYDGTLLLVSHDHVCIDKVANRILELTPNSLLSFPGSYEEYKYYKKSHPHNQEESNTVSESQKSTSTSTTSTNLFALRKQIKTIEATIARLEHEQKKLEFSFAQLEYGTSPYNTALSGLNTIKKELDSALREWEMAQQALEN